LAAGLRGPRVFPAAALPVDEPHNEGGFVDEAFDELIEKARQDRSDRGRLERFHEADRYAVAERVAVIPLVYGRSTAFVRPRVEGWWEFGKTSASFADLTVDPVR
jgi:ABC-type oligopeptide transport system substrate-binding subunit